MTFNLQDALWLVLWQQSKEEHHFVLHLNNNFFIKLLNKIYIILYHHQVVLHVLPLEVFWSGRPPGWEPLHLASSKESPLPIIYLIYKVLTVQI